MSYQTIKFGLFAFRGAVTARPSSPNSDLIEYRVGSKIVLEVVFQSGPGVPMTTYVFQLKEGDTVMVCGDVIHVPERCVKRLDGNQITCEDSE
jgi:hypothetical protein